MVDQTNPSNTHKQQNPHALKKKSDIYLRGRHRWQGSAEFIAYENLERNEMEKSEATNPKSWSFSIISFLKYIEIQGTMSLMYTIGINKNACLLAW